MMPLLTRLSSSLCLLLLLCANLVIQVENKTFFGIGTRINGDQLLLKDVLQTPPFGLTEEPVIKFKYAITEPITYLEIEADKSVLAKVNFSYEHDLIEGIISSGSDQVTPGDSIKREPFEVLIRIFGFNDTIVNINPAYILNKEQFSGILLPMHNPQQQINQTLSLMEEDSKALEDFDIDYHENAVDGNENISDEEDADYEDYVFNSDLDKIIEQGERQEGDFLVYDVNQTSPTATEFLTNHSVTFYYVDIFYITYLKFIIYEYYFQHPLDNYDNTCIVEYAQISPTTLKAIVTDHRTTSLIVQLQMYGFHPTALPVDYKPFLSNSQTSANARPISKLTQLKMLMNAQQSTTKQQQQQQHQQQNENNRNGNLLESDTELGQQISADDKSKVNCMQQVLPTATFTRNNSQRIFPYGSIFNFIVIVFGTMRIFL